MLPDTNIQKRTVICELYKNKNARRNKLYSLLYSFEEFEGK
jgi:uncharacterized Fe-S cluster-containing MiaB family protein